MVGKGRSDAIAPRIIMVPMVVMLRMPSVAFLLLLARWRHRHPHPRPYPRRYREIKGRKSQTRTAGRSISPIAFRFVARRQAHMAREKNRLQQQQQEPSKSHPFACSGSRGSSRSAASSAADSTAESCGKGGGRLIPTSILPQQRQQFMLLQGRPTGAACERY